MLTAIYAWVFHLDVAAAVYSSSLMLLFLLPFSLYYFFQSFALKCWTAFAAIVLFLFIGGIQFLDSSLKASEPLTNQFNEGSVFTQFVIFELFPQRAFLFGLIAFSFLIGFLVRLQNTKKISTQHWLLIGLGLGLTPLLHLHTWIASAVFLLFVFIFPIKEAYRKSLFKFGLGVALFSLIWIYFLLIRGEKSHQGGWDYWFPGWAQNSKAGLKGAMEMNPFGFWIYNTGILLPLMGFGFYRQRKTKTLFALFASGVFLFLVGLLFNIQPYFYDNLKIFTYAFLFLAPFAALGIQAIFEFKYSKWLAPLLVIFQCTTGFLDLQFMASKRQTATFFSAEEITLAKEFKEVRSSADALVLIVPRHNHWLPCLSGNPVAMGYPGWLWSWGINYAPREQEVNQIFLGAPNALSLIHQLGIRYMVVNKHESIGTKSINFEFLKSQFPLALERGDWLVYSVNK